MTLRERLGTFGVALATITYLAAMFSGWTAVAYAAKPLIVVSCLGLAASATGSMRPWVMAGLAWSLGGDVALMLPGDYFVVGLALFLVAHLCYIVAFTRGGWRATPIPALIVGAYLMLMVTLLVPSLGPMRAPVVAYATVISLMVWQALERAAALHTTAARMVALGAVMFIVSDTALAVNRFMTPLPFERLLVIATYALAQYAIALGTLRGSVLLPREPGQR